MFERETLIIFCSPPACRILKGVTGVRLSLQNAFIAPTLCVCVGAYVCVCVLRYLHAINPPLMKWKRLTGIKGLSLKDNGSSMPLVVQQKGGRALLMLKNAGGGEKGEEKLGEFEHLWGRQKYPEQVCLQLLIFYKLMSLVWCGHQI